MEVRQSKGGIAGQETRVGGWVGGLGQGVKPGHRVAGRWVAKQGVDPSTIG